MKSDKIPPFGWLTSVIVSAGESIDILANLDPQTRLGSMLADSLGTITAMADKRLRLRCLIHWPTDMQDRKQVRADFFGDEINKIGWDVRTIPTRPTMDLIVVDGSICHAVQEDGRSMFTTKSGDTRTVQTFCRHFNELWSAATNIDGGKELIFENLLLPTLPTVEQSIIHFSRDTWDQIIANIVREPEELFHMAPRRFEELIAELLVRGMRGRRF